MPASEQSEQVLCIPASQLPQVDGRPFQGFQTCALGPLEEMLSYAQWIDRDKAETDPTWKQVIPYAFLHQKDCSLYWYRRSGGEGRLIGKASLGIGGHIHPSDRPSNFTRNIQIVREALLREFVEELGVVGGSFVFRGMVNDDSDPVGQVHLGLVYSYRWHNEVEPSVKEGQGIFSLGFHPCDHPPVPPEDMESWSRIVWQALQERVWS